ncbi:primosomal protein N' [Methylocaldum sp.]|uniref:primosomal protein N' n=1 Tax=Methylocaldum sp. TaxID=1969727 RepID=UPI002D340612|nr:primosomal protein N' [Methylocaldum sp.]HYE36870.1 primosomal protein N' [Methylocaldum sp.]
MPKILKIAVSVPLRRLFDYLPPPNTNLQDLTCGVRIEVPFGRRRKIGILLEISEESVVDHGRLKEALAILDSAPLLSPDDLRLLRWASQYYHYPIGEVVSAALTVLLRKGSAAELAGERRLRLTEEDNTVAEQSCKRAPRQTALIGLLREHPDGVPYGVLSGLDWDWRGAADGLIRKGMACWCQSQEAQVPARHLFESPPFELNEGQQHAIATVREAMDAYSAFLLEGVTGSGKTEVYLQLTQEVLERGKQIMILLPEINLTPQLEARFRTRFSVPVAIFHSGLTETERCRSWLRMQRGEVGILLGTRSAVFTPMKSPGMIILDEEHDTSFKQQDGFRFSARDVAVMRARLLNIPILLGSATPSLESLCNVWQGRYRHLQLLHRAGGAVQPSFRLLDIRAQRLREGLSPALIAYIADTLSRGEQALLFVNRRGFAPTLICHACGWVARCRRCDANLVVHAGDERLRCHHCGFEQSLASSCTGCGCEDLRPLGLGTERVEKVLAELFPDARVARIDRDSTRRKGQLEALLNDIHEGRVDILIGTQMLAKGHHFPRVTLVGITDVDSGLYSTDFRSGERTAQLITQVAGRAGREERMGAVVLQTRHPGHPLLQVLIRDGYSGFAKACSEERRAAHLPPFTYQILWRAEASDAEAPLRFLDRVANLAHERSSPGLQVLGPVPAPMARRAGRQRYQLLFQSSKRNALHSLINTLLPMVSELEEVKRVRWSIDIDPVDLY